MAGVHYSRQTHQPSSAIPADQKRPCLARREDAIIDGLKKRKLPAFSARGGSAPPKFVGGWRNSRRPVPARQSFSPRAWGWHRGDRHFRRQPEWSSRCFVSQNKLRGLTPHSEVPPALMRAAHRVGMIWVGRSAECYRPQQTHFMKHFQEVFGDS